jgi:hypothetical protein
LNGNHCTPAAQGVVGFFLKKPQDPETWRSFGQHAATEQFRKALRDGDEREEAALALRTQDNRKP